MFIEINPFVVSLLILLKHIFFIFHSPYIFYVPKNTVYNQNATFQINWRSTVRFRSENATFRILL